MTLYCQAGDIARVTLPDGSIQDFIDTPVTIIHEINYIGNYQQNYDPTGYRITFYSTNNRISLNPTCYEFYTINYIGWHSGGWQEWQCAIYWRECTGVWQGVNAIYPSAPDLIIDKSVKCGSPEQPTQECSLTITGSSGIVLFTGNFSNCNYSVECVQECPPNTLDCGNGNCCSCDEIYNGISEIRNLLSRLR